MSDTAGSDNGLPNEDHNNEGLHRRNRIPTDLALQITTDEKANGDANGRIAGGVIAPRPTYTEVQLEKAYQLRMDPEEQKAYIQYLKEERKAAKEVVDKRTVAKMFCLKTFPFIDMLRTYNFKEYGALDLVSGISVGLFLIPQSIAYSLLANVRPQYGFYSAFFAMVVYFFIGSSRHVNLTNQGAVSLLVGEAVRAGMDQVYPGGAGLCAVTVATTAAPNGTAGFNTSFLSTTPAYSTAAYTNATSAR